MNLMDLLAIPLAAGAGFLAGGMWYGFWGERWMRAAGLTKDDISDGSPLPFVLAAVADLVIAALFFLLLPQLFGPAAGWLQGMKLAGLIWLGFILPVMAVNYSFQMRPLALALIDAGNWLLAFLVMGAVTGAMNG